MVLPDEGVGDTVARVAVLGLKTPLEPTLSDEPVEREQRPQEGSDPWRMVWLTDEHRRLEILGDCKVPGELGQRSMGGQGRRAREGSEEIVDQLVRWYLGVTIRPRTEEAGWCRHIFVNTAKLRTGMPTGSSTTATRHAEGSLRHVT